MDDAAAIQRMRDELPEEERKGNMGKILGYVLDLCQSGWSFRQALSNVGEMCTLGEHIETIEAMLERITEDGKDAILRAVDYQKKNATEAMLEYCWNELGISLLELHERIAEDKITDHQKTRGDSKRNKRFPEEREQQGYHRCGLWISLRRSISMREALYGVENHLHRVKSHQQQP